MGTITNTCADVSVIIALAGVIITFVGVIVALGIFIRQNKQIKKIVWSYLPIFALSKDTKFILWRLWNITFIYSWNFIQATFYQR